MIWETTSFPPEAFSLLISEHVLCLNAGKVPSFVLDDQVYSSGWRMHKVGSDICATMASSV